MSASLSGACGGVDCTAVSQPQFSFSVRSTSGADLTSTANFVIRRLEGNPPVPVDSVFGREFEVDGRFQNVVSSFHVTIRHVGYEPHDQMVYSTPDPWAGGCGPEVKHQVITATLAPAASAGSEPRARN